MQMFLFLFIYGKPGAQSNNILQTRSEAVGMSSLNKCMNLTVLLSCLSNRCRDGIKGRETGAGMRNRDFRLPKLLCAL
jgi:hypothetical protein